MPGFSCVAGRRSRRFAVCGRSRGGIIGSGGGVTSLVSYPALLAVGIPPLPANIANLVAGVAIGPGAALGSRRELVETRTVLVRLLPITSLGSHFARGGCRVHRDWTRAVGRCAPASRRTLDWQRSRTDHRSTSAAEPGALDCCNVRVHPRHLSLGPTAMSP